MICKALEVRIIGADAAAAGENYASQKLAQDQQ